tara:strand:- start:1551 stop:2066 length:516 start_codon:yes stop_codon:yes gene_type:complete
MLKEIFNRIENVCAIVMIVAFFLPWLSFFMWSISGYEISEIRATARPWIDMIEEVMTEQPNEGPSTWSLYNHYLIPLFAISVLATDYLQTSKKVVHYMAIAAGVYPLYFFTFELNIFDLGNSDNPFDTAITLGIGVYLTILASIIMLLSTFGVVKRRKESNIKLNDELDNN